MEPIAERQSIDATGIKFRPVHPGFMLAEEMEARGLNANSLALRLKVPRTRLTEIIHERRAITPDTALRLERHLGIPARLWLDMQTQYDLAIAERDHGDEIMFQVMTAK
jgi:addiction module HigA family antidote